MTGSTFTLPFDGASPLAFEQTAFLFDIDGTLLDIAPKPDDVRVPERLPSDLARLADCVGGALALVTGRPLDAVDRFFAPRRLPAAACHGAEIRPARDAPTIVNAAPLSDILKAQLRAAAQRIAGVAVEDKIYSFALHYREVPASEGALLDAVRAICARAPAGSVVVLQGKCVIEVKTPGFDKGTGVRALMAAPAFAGRRPIFLGDDVTDEDAMAVLPGFGGIGIAVGRPLGCAQFLFASPEDVRRWIAGIACG